MLSYRSLLNTIPAAAHLLYFCSDDDDYSPLLEPVAFVGIALSVPTALVRDHYGRHSRHGALLPLLASCYQPTQHTSKFYSFIGVVFGVLCFYAANG